MKFEDMLQLAALGLVLYLVVKKSQASTPTPPTPAPSSPDWGILAPDGGWT